MLPQCRSNGFIACVGFVILCQIMAVCCIDMCTNGTETGNDVFFTRTSNGITNCHCTINTPNFSKIVFNRKAHKPTGCGLSLVVMFQSTTHYYSCRNYEIIFYTISNNEEIELRLEPGSSATGDFEFGFKIDSQPTGSIFTISCYGLPNPPITQRSTETSLQTDISSESTGASLQTTATLQYATTYDHLTSTTHTSLTAQSLPDSSIISTISETPTANYSLYLVPGIVGGIVGTTVVIVVFVIITLCILKIRKYNSKSTSPTQAGDPDYLEIVS